MDPSDPPGPRPIDDSDRTLSYLPTGPGSTPEEATIPGRPWADWGGELRTFASTLIALGLAGEGELRRVLGGLPGPPRDAAVMAQELIRAGVLTGYQAGAVLQGKTKGLVLGNYVVLDKLGAGGGGMVLKVRHRKLGRVVALKILPPSVTSNPSTVLRFEREVRVAAQLIHPNVVAALDADEYQGLHFLVMEYVEGRDLASIVATDGPLSEERALGLLIQASRGLQAAHGRGIVHRDIKPSNLMLDTSGTVKVLDMGLARMTGEADLEHPAVSPALTQVGTIMGTVDFMSPEQAYDSKNADERSDIYSLGCTLAFLLTGRPPYGGATVVQRILAHREHPIPSLPNVRPALDDLVRRMLAKDPSGRPQTLAKVIAEMEAIRDGEAKEPVLVEPAPAPSGRPGPRSRKALAVAIAALVGIAGLAVYLRPRQVRDVASVEPAGVIEPARPPVAEAPERPAAPPTSAEPAPEPEPTPAPREDVGEVGRLQGHQERVEAVAISPDGRSALSGGRDGTVRLWDLAERKEVFKGDHHGPVYAVAFRADGRRALSAGEDGNVLVWDLDALPERRALSGHAGRVLALACSRAGPGSFAMTGGVDKTVRVWDLQADREACRFDTEGTVAAVVFPGDGKSPLSAGDDRSIRLWDVGSRREAGRIDVGYKVLCLAPSPDGRKALAGGRDGALTLQDLGGGKSVRLEGHRAWVMSAGFLSDGVGVSGDSSGALIVWDLKGGRALTRFETDGGGHRGIAILPDGRHALTADDDGLVRVWNLPPAQ